MSQGLRLAAAPDFAAIAAITNHYIATTAIHFGDRPVTAAELRELWEEHAQVYPWLVVEAAGKVAGYAKAGVFRARAAYRWTTEIGVYLDPACRGRGLGRLVYGRLCAMLQVQGFHAAIGGIAMPNDASVRLHEQLGFTHWGTLRRAGRKFDRWHDVSFWQLALQPPDAPPREIGTPAAAFLATGQAPAAG